MRNNLHIDQNINYYIFIRFIVLRFDDRHDKIGTVDGLVVIIMGSLTESGQVLIIITTAWIIIYKYI